MCGRYASSKGADELIEYFEATLEAPSAVSPAASPAASSPNLAPSWNVAPTAQIYAILDPARLLTTARWGLVPSWAKSLDFAAKTINARVETVADKPSFRSAFKSRRAIIPADGYYEWYTASGPVSRKQPFYICARDRSPLAMAGLYEWWVPSDGGAPVLTATVLTRDATPQIAEIHDRMPLMLPRAAWSEWLGGKLSSVGELLSISETLQELDAYPVSSAVNSSRENRSSLIDPVPLELEQVLW
ncbi:unannotated protein [freshwater metagenome]|uniref:Unannotated protein n=1 Tax=freshwater metagenome TaxID=449393 RepID=A0A6J6LZS9_9ZZZZ|nr:hypothetical protein [Actinomycetota bacterium]MSY52427.1 hypothetical protein [Actinomycetota bacterium]MSY86878.1 hypothetical protein [Actinomycetota bacterium]